MKEGTGYHTLTHDSLKISNGMWHWFSRGIGGKTALDYLIHVKGMEFVPAVQVLTGIWDKMSQIKSPAGDICPRSDTVKDNPEGICP